MKKILLSAAAAIVSLQAHAANIPLITGPQEPSQLLGIINTIISNINAGTSGLVSVGTSTMGTFATTSELTLQSVVIPANTLTIPGHSLRVRCLGTLGANSNLKAVRVYVATGTSPFNGMNGGGGPAWAGTAGATGAGGAGFVSFGSSASNLNGGSWDLDLLLTNMGAAAASNLPATVAWTGRGTIQNNQTVSPNAQTSLVSSVHATSSSLDWKQNIIASCAGTTSSTASVGDVSNSEIIVEQVK